MITIRVSLRKLKGISKDFLYTVSAVLVLNIVQQLLIQPYVNQVMGAEYLGNMLYYLGVSYVFPQMFGTVLGHQRILYKHDSRVVEGDFLAILATYCAMAFCIGGIDAYLRTSNPAFSIAVAAFMVISTLRYYGQVEFRLTLFFKGYLIYFLILSAGYCFGLIPFHLTHQWIMLFIFGELAAVLYVVRNGSVFSYSKPSEMFKKLWLPSTLLVISYLLSSTSYLDRVVIKTILGDLAVSQYYAVSLFSKIINMLVQPVATLMLSYLADRKTSTITVSNYFRIVVAGMLATAVLTAICCIGTPLAVGILYPNLLDVVPDLNLAVNVGTVLGFAGQLLLVFLLAEAPLRFQLIIRGICFAVYLASSVLLSIHFGLPGYVYSTILSNGFCLAMTIMSGLLFFNSKTRKPEDLREERCGARR